LGAFSNSRGIERHKVIAIIAATRHIPVGALSFIAEVLQELDNLRGLCQVDAMGGSH
jgi:hypothetical protein